MRKISIFLWINFLALSMPLPLSLGQQAGEAPRVEIFAGGKKYDSLEIYKEKGLLARGSGFGTQGGGEGLDDKKQDVQELRNMFQQAVRHAQRPLDLKFDPNKIKTIYLKNPSHSQTLEKSEGVSLPLRDKNAGVADPFAHSYVILNEMGSNTGIAKVVEDFVFEKDHAVDLKSVNAKDIEQVLRQSFEQGNYSGPLLLMSDHKKIRVMALDSQDGAVISGDQPRTQ